MKLNDSQKKLFELVKKWHGDQKRKYTGEPYYNHPLSVAEIASAYCTEFGIIETALCHDVLEDTKFDETDLYNGLLSCGYNATEATLIINHVNDLTDEYTKEKYPNTNRTDRKMLECGRLACCDYLTQSVKYADLIDNTSSIVERDPNFARVYLKEKRQMLKYMTAGNVVLMRKCIESLEQSEEKIFGFAYSSDKISTSDSLDRLE